MFMFCAGVQRQCGKTEELSPQPSGPGWVRETEGHSHCRSQTQGKSSNTKCVRTARKSTRRFPVAIDQSVSLLHTYNYQFTMSLLECTCIIIASLQNYQCSHNVITWMYMYNYCKPSKLEFARRRRAALTSHCRHSGMWSWLWWI